MNSMDFTGYISKETDPAINLALEEHFLKFRQENIFFLYTNEASIIAGKHQNILAEINYKKTKELNIPVFRRLSGGGTVYHDLGNLNYCFITNTKPGELINFKHFSSVMADKLTDLGLPATVGKRNEINIDGLKVSGTASHVYKNRSLHHGTLLFESNLTNLNECLKNNPHQYIDKAVKSVKSEVTNISSQLTRKMSYESFCDYIFNSIIKKNSKLMELSQEEITQINDLAENKFRTWDWNFGYNPEYKSIKTVYIPKMQYEVQIEMTIKKGMIENLQTNSNDQTVNEVFRKLINTSLEPTSITEILKADIINKFGINQNHNFIDELF